MDYRRICILPVLILLPLSAFSQIDSTFKDTIKEITIYEYDTVYIEPDTIWLTNTIVDTTKTMAVKEKELDSSHFSSSKLNSFLLFLVPNSISINVVPFIGGNLKEKELSDSLSSQPVINQSFLLQLNYNSGKYTFSLGAGFTPYHEKYHFQRTYYSSNFDSNSFEPYDSLLIKKEYTSDYYYNYLNLYVLFGRKWILSNKLSLSLNTIFSSDFLMGYKQGNTNDSVSLVRKFDISIGLGPQIAYKLWQNLEVYLSPFYQHSLFEDKKYPYTSFQKTGIGAGFNIIL